MSTNPMAPVQGWISARHVRHMIVRGEAAGLPMDELLAEAGLARAALADADGLVPIRSVEAMLAALSRRSADPLPGLRLAGDIQPATFGPLGHILQACARFGDVLDVVTRYNGLLSDVGTTSVRSTPEGVEVSWECSAGGEAFRRHSTEYVLGAFVVLARLLVPERRLLLQRVLFSHAPPADPERLREYAAFFRCPVSFDQPSSALLLPAGVITARMRHGDALLKDVLERHAQDLLRRRERRTTLADAVRQLVEATILDGAPARARVAAQLGVSARSLHRKLEALGTGYRQILDEVRLALAQERLRDSLDPLDAIAERVGFRSQQAFLRWFRERAGTTPGAYRRGAARARA